MIRLIRRAAVAAFVITATSAHADPGRDAILADLMTQAKTTDAAFAAFAPERGKAFFLATQSGGKPDTTSCSACHTKNPKAVGQTRAGKEIAPMAVSKTPDRFTDAEKVAKWFLRNCNSVLGRECTPAEKGDFIAFMVSQ
jgi:mono/diheme cytochrome c family protein